MLANPIIALPRRYGEANCYFREGNLLSGQLVLIFIPNTVLRIVVFSSKFQKKPPYLYTIGETTEIYFTWTVLCHT